MSVETKRTVIRAPASRSLDSDVQVLQYAPGSAPNAAVAGKPTSKGAFHFHGADGTRYQAVSTYRRQNHGPLSRTTWFYLTPQTAEGTGATELQATPVDEIFSVRRDIASDVAFVAPQEAALDAYAKRAARAFKFDGEAELDTELYAEQPPDATAEDAPAANGRTKGAKAPLRPAAPQPPASKGPRVESAASKAASAAASTRVTPMPAGPVKQTPAVPAAAPASVVPQAATPTPSVPAGSSVGASPTAASAPQAAAVAVEPPRDLDAKVKAFVDARRGGGPATLVEVLGAVLKSLADFERYGGHADKAVKRAWFNLCKERTQQALEVLGCSVANNAVTFPS
mmetsp:Transcript_49708/g.153605  ORF Transcript_49708/g.153605 Transcript_49708/m.153605 type:complete len:341 (-) Transcript_49708:99-1121(-)